MEAFPFAAAAGETASAALVLSKAAWKLGNSLSNLSRDTQLVDPEMENVANDVKVLGTECDVLYTELEKAKRSHETRSIPAANIDYDHKRLWNCLTVDIDEAGRSLQELEMLMRRMKDEEARSGFYVQDQSLIDRSKTQIASIRTQIRRNADQLRTLSLTVNM